MTDDQDQVTMNHLDETTLELFVLKSPEIDSQRPEIEQHIQECAGCRELYDAIASFYADVKDDLESTENLPALRKVGLPVKSVTELDKYYNLTDFRGVDLPAPYRITRWLVRHPYIAASGTLMGFGLVAALLVLALLPKNSKPKDLNPTHADFQGEMMLVKNMYGETVDEIRIGAPEVKGAIEGMHLVDFQDVDGDGVNEVLWIEIPPSGIDASSRVICKSLSKGRVLWTETLARRIVFPLQPQIQSANWRGKSVRAGDLDNDGKPVVYVLASHIDYFSNILFKLDARTGTELGSYLNPGGLGEFHYADVSGGRNEIILAGINNAFDEACIVILDPRFITGHAPTQGNYILRGIPPGLERAYIRVPKTLLAGAFAGRVRWNDAVITSVNPQEKSFTAAIYDLDVTDSNGQRFVATYYITFDERLAPKVVNTGDDWDALAKRLYMEHRIPFIPDQQYFEKFVKTIQYWDGDNWTNQPTLNKRYLEAVAKLKQPM